MALDKKRARELFFIWGHIVLDAITLLFLLGLFLLTFFLQQSYGLVNRLGFFCDDISIRHPYVQQHVPDWVIPLLSLATSVIVVSNL